MRPPLLRAAGAAGATLIVCGTAVLGTGVAGAAFPNANGKIVFTSTRANIGGSTTAGNLFLVSPAGVQSGGATVTNDPAQTTELTATSADDQGGFFSPDGSQVVFFSNRGVGNQQLWKVSASNLPAVQDTSGTSAVGTPAPDGAVKLLSDARQDTWPSWSPDGHTVAFVSGSNLTTGKEIDTLDTSVPGASPTKVVTDTIALARPVFDPADATKLVYTSAVSGHLILVTGLGTPLQATVDLSANTGIDANSSDEAPDFSPDGQTIIFDSTRPVTGAAGANQLFTLSLAAAQSPGATASPVFVNSGGTGTFSGGSDTQPVFSPDGKQISFTRAVNGQDVNSYMLRPTPGDHANPGMGLDLTLAPTNPADNQPDWQGVAAAPPVLPESPWAVGLPVAGLALIGGAVLLSRRRQAT